MALTWWMTYVATCFVFSLSPGSGAVNTASIGISHGCKTALISIIGLQAGLACHILLVGVGLGTLLAHSPAVLALLRLVGAAYLIWLGIRQCRESGALRLDRSRVVSRGLLLRQSLLVNLTNPKTILFLAALFPQFLIPDQESFLQYVVLGGTTLIMDSLIMILYAVIAGAFSQFVSTSSRMTCVNRLFGGIFILIGVLLALTH